MIVAGVDPATKELAISFLEKKKDKIELIDVFQISTHEDSLPDRLGYIYDEATKLFKKYQPEHIGVENQYLSFNPHAYRLICYSVGVLCAASFASCDAKITVIEAKKWRRLALGEGKGGAKKQDVIKAIKDRFGLDESGYTDDQFEAIGIGVAMCEILDGKK